LPRDKNLTKKKYNFCQKKKFSQEEIQILLINRSLAKNRYRFSQEEIERVGKGLVVSWLGLG
jgi:hypothetical protein